MQFGIVFVLGVFGVLKDLLIWSGGSLLRAVDFWHEDSVWQCSGVLTSVRFLCQCSVLISLGPLGV